jgi:predicted Zn-ribbon and HTH transcriptional regulator
MPEVQDVFRLYGDAYRQTHGLSLVQLKVMSAIEKCRTAELGSHVDICENCGDIEISYNSCRNRHCPKCQTLAKERWIDNQKYNLLNVGYFHVVFTVPNDLRPVFYQNQSILYPLMFQAVSETLKELAANKKYLGAQLGFTAVMHTWGQNLSYHTHIHCIVPAGGLSNHNKWVHSRKKFFIPVKVLSRKFRGKLLCLLQSKNICSNLEFFGNYKHLSIKHLSIPHFFQNLMRDCFNKEWIVYCKPPFKSSAHVVEYLGRYTHRVAISNNRILKIENGQVSFKWRDYKDNNQWKVMTVSAFEFIRRFLQHVLPRGFMKIRHYGLFASRNKTKKLNLCKLLTHTPIVPKHKASTLDLLRKMLGLDPSICRHCGKPRHPNALSPPLVA